MGDDAALHTSRDAGRYAVRLGVSDGRETRKEDYSEAAGGEGYDEEEAEEAVEALLRARAGDDRRGEVR